jgi:large subunit ribosomal protein L21
MKRGTMNLFFAFVLGVLVGWLVEWLIDFFYWRRRHSEKEAKIRSQNIILSDRAAAPVVQSPKPVAPAAPSPQDNLQIIKGIGPVIERKLNEAGVFTFAELGRLTAEDLRNILGKTIQRLADEDDLLRQARDLAGRN